MPYGCKQLPNGYGNHEIMRPRLRRGRPTLLKMNPNRVFTRYVRDATKGVVMDVLIVRRQIDNSLVAGGIRII